MAGLFAIVAICALYTGCSKEHVEALGSASVKIHVSGFSVTQEEIPQGKSAQNVENYEGVKAIDLAFYEGTNEIYKTTQMRNAPSTYTTFGEFECNLPVGHYTMVVVARGYSDGDVFVLSSPTSAAYTTERARETFCTTQSVSVTDTSSLDVSVTLSRIMTKLNILSTDVCPASVSRIRTTYSAGGKGFNPTTGLATSNDGFSLTNTRSLTASSTLDVSSYAFLASDEQTMTITIEALDADENVMSTRVVSNVPLKRNRVTTLSGAIFSADTSFASIMVETGWIDGNTVEF